MTCGCGGREEEEGEVRGKEEKEGPRAIMNCGMNIQKQIQGLVMRNN